ncbi:MAG: SpoIIE family protein phosphatase [Solirubrobacteraceae bacterium]
MTRRGAIANPYAETEAHWWVLPLGLAVVGVLTALDASRSEVFASTVVLGPFVCALLGSTRDTVITGAAAVGSALLSGLWNHNFGDLDYFVRLSVVTIGTAVALAGARARVHLTRDRERFRMLRAVAELSERSTTVDETLEQISDILVPGLSDICIIDVLREERVERLAVAAHGPRSEAIAAGLRARATRGGTTPTEGERLVEVCEDAMLRAAALDDEDLDFLRSLGLRSVITVPLRARGRRIGTMGLSVTTQSRRAYDADELAFTLVLAGRVALALDNAGLFSEIETLVAQQAAALGSLAEAVTMQDPSGALVYANAAAARSMGFASVEEMLSTPPETIADLFESYLEDGTALRTELLPGRRVLAGEDPPPLLLRTVSRRTGEEHWRVTKATGVRDQQGRVRLAVNVIEDVTEVKRIERAQRLLAEAGSVLASSLDYEETLARVARLAIGTLADWCGVSLPGEHGELRSVAVAHVDPSLVRYARELNERFPSRMDDPTGAAEVIRSGTSQVFNEITPELLEQSGADPEQLAAIDRLGMRAAMIVPMVAAGRAIGAISFVSAESGRAFTDADLDLAEELGRRAGVAVENARLYTERSHIANTLQSSLLPAKLPPVPGFALASLYRPAGEENWVGGDFYDAFATSGGWMVVVGDVAGRGAAAAALTAQARHTLRTAAQLIGDPIAALTHLNQALVERRDTSLCTVAAVQLSGRDGSISANVVCAGHPQPYLVREGTAMAIGYWGPMVGAFEDSEWRAATITLQPADVLVLYTDGVIDAGGPEERFGDERLVQTLTGATDASDAVGRIRAALDAFEVGAQADDTAVLAIAYTGDRARVA